jgi:hypothetical protein
VLRERAVIARGRIAVTAWIDRSATAVVVEAAASADGDVAASDRISRVTVRRAASAMSAVIVRHVATAGTVAIGRTTSRATRARQSFWWWTERPAAGSTRRAIPDSFAARSTAI